jgi:hypothetical protein
MSIENPIHPTPESRSEAWEADRRTEATPLPFAHVRKYEHPGQRQADLDAAGKSNIARAAGELGLTSDEYNVMRMRLGRSPSRDDIIPKP